MKLNKNMSQLFRLLIAKSIKSGFQFNGSNTARLIEKVRQLVQLLGTQLIKSEHVLLELLGRKLTRSLEPLSIKSVIRMTLNTLSLVRCGVECDKL